jgi:hypothetical protein
MILKSLFTPVGDSSSSGVVIEMRITTVISPPNNTMNDVYKI